jgi:hypothetical protein
MAEVKPVRYPGESLVAYNDRVMGNTSNMVSINTSGYGGVQNTVTGNVLSKSKLASYDSMPSLDVKTTGQSMNGEVTYSPYAGAKPEASWGDKFNIGDQADWQSKVDYYNNRDTAFKAKYGENWKTDMSKTDLVAADKQWNAEQLANKTDWAGWAGVGIGAANLGLGIVSYLDNKKTAKKQRKILQQQYDNNVTEMKYRDQRRSDWDTYDERHKQG